MKTLKKPQQPSPPPLIELLNEKLIQNLEQFCKCC